MHCFSASPGPLFSRLKKTLKLEPSLPPVEPQKVNVNGHAATVGNILLLPCNVLVNSFNQCWD